MNSMNDERFFDLAMKAIARQGTDAERAELDALLAREPELKTEFERLRVEVGVTKEALPLVNATEATAGEIPAYARGRLQTKVRQTLGRPQPADDSKREREHGAMWTWRWALGLAAATAVIAVIVLPNLKTSSEPIFQLAMLDTTGVSRGSETNEVILLQQTWTKATVDSFSKPELLRTWETNWPSNPNVVKIIYDPAAAEVRLLGRFKSEEFSKTFTVENSLADTLKQAREYLAEQTKP